MGWAAQLADLVSTALHRETAITAGNGNKKQDWWVADFSIGHNSSPGGKWGSLLFTHWEPQKYQPWPFSCLALGLAKGDT